MAPLKDVAAAVAYKDEKKKTKKEKKKNERRPKKEKRKRKEPENVLVKCGKNTRCCARKIKTVKMYYKMHETLNMYIIYYANVKDF